MLPVWTASGLRVELHPSSNPAFSGVLSATPVLLEGEKVRAENAETKRTHCRRSYDGG